MDRGLVFDFHRGTTHDGPGMRTTVFFKGCPLHCEWCHNPESINPERELQWDAKKCIGCGMCVDNCHQKAISNQNGRITVNSDLCRKCYQCADNCPAKALKTVGTYWTVETLVKEACKDKMFFGDFGGGITVSGGEPVLQNDILQKILEQLKKEEVNIAVDTSGFGKWEIYEKIYPYVDVFLYDIKFIDPQLHEKYTGVNNKLILDNLKMLADRVRKDESKKIWIRTPLIPEATATEKNVGEIGAFIKKELIDVIERWELCAFNNVCKEKYRKLNRKWKYEKTELMDEKTVGKLKEIAESYAGDLVTVSGLTKK